MIACKTEYESRVWRDGMIEGLSEGLHLGSEYLHDGDRLYLELMRRIVKLVPRPYRRYVRAYYRQPLCPGIETKLLSYWQWRTCAAELAGVVQADAVLGRSSPTQEEELRSVLLLAPGEASAAPYQALLAACACTDPEPQQRDGLIDACFSCYARMHDDYLEGDEYFKAVSQDLYAWWPQDYFQYARRYFDLYTQGHGLIELGFPIRYPQWCDVVRDLQVEIARCQVNEEPSSPNRVQLQEWLLLQPQQGAPSLDWTMPAQFDEKFSW
jgi:hypothetical protein